jgi:uncharacterized protein (DUF2147 family)
MKKLTIVAALFMATTSAHAGGVTLQINGERVRIEAPRHCDALSCIQITAPGFSGSLGNINLKGFGSKNSDDEDVASTPAPSAPAPVQATAPRPTAPVATNVAPAPVPAPVPATAIATASPAAIDVAPSTPAPAAIAPAPQPAPVAAAPPTDPTTPIGIWATEENKGNVRVEACGSNLCGYAVKSNEKILISMKPQGSKWTGQIHDPDSGRNYDSTIAMKGPNTMRVQGCAFGGMFCGGQTWKRVS